MKDVRQLLQQHADYEIPELEYPWQYLEYMLGHYTSHNSNIEQVDIQENVIIRGLVLFGKNCMVGPFTLLRGPLILGDNVRIGPHSEIVRSIVLNNTQFSHRNCILDSVIGQNVKFSSISTISNSVLGRDYINAIFNGKKHRVTKKYGAYIGDDVVIGTSTHIQPGACVAPGLINLGHGIIYGNSKEKSFLSKT